jgi:predicted MFS family arabinose efflux permease
MNKNRVSISLLFFLCGINFASWATRIPDFKEKLSLNDSELGTILMGLPVGSLVSLPLAGWLITKYESKWICLAAIILYIFIMPTLGYSPSPLSLFIGLFLFGMAGDILNIAMNTQVVTLENSMSKLIMSSFHALFSLGLMLGAFCGGIILNYHISSFNHLLIIGLLNLISIPFFISNLLPDSFKNKNENVIKNKKSYFDLGPHLLTLSFIAFCGMLCEGAMADWITLYFKESTFIKNFSTTVGFTSFALSMVIGRSLGDYFTKLFPIKNILSINGLLISLGLCITLGSNNEYAMILGCLISGIGISTIVPIIYSEAGRSTSISPSMAIASVSTIAYIGFLLGPVIIGYLSAYWGLNKALYLLVAMGFLASLLAKFKIRIDSHLGIDKNTNAI